jgi:hypothetical protein
MHLIFIMSDLMTYKEVVGLFPQMEYLCEVMFLEDLTQKDYVEMSGSFLMRSNISDEILGDDQQLSKSFVEVRNRVKAILLKTFYSPKMLRNTVREELLTRGAAEFIFNNPEMISGNVFSSNQGYRVIDRELQQTMLNLPVEVFTLNKHRFGLLLEVFRFLFDLISMHLSIRKAYYETFLAKSSQFQKYFMSVKDTKQRLHDD